MKMHILYPFDTGYEFSFTVKDLKSRKKVGLDLTTEVEVYPKLFKFGIGVLDVVVGTDRINLKTITTAKVSKRKTMIEFCEQVVADLLPQIKKFAVKQYSTRYSGNFLYPVVLGNYEKITNAYSVIRVDDTETLEVIKFVLAQYWNLLSYDWLLTTEIESVRKILDDSKFFNLNFFLMVKMYLKLSKDTKDFYQDKLNILDSITGVAEDISGHYHPELLEKYDKIKDVFRIKELTNDVNMKLTQISDSYNFIRDTISTAFFIFLEIIFVLSLLWGIFDTLLLWVIAKK